MKSAVLKLLCLCSLALLASEAFACASGYIYMSGRCVKWTKGVLADVDLKNLANAEQNPKRLDLRIDPSTTVAGLLFCGNRASNQPPGIVPVIFSQPFFGSTFITSATGGGANRVSVTALLSAEQLAALDVNCPNRQNFDALDFVPCEMATTLQLSDVNKSSVLESYTDKCTLPNCSTLKWDRKTGMPERREYSCPLVPKR